MDLVVRVLCAGHVNWDVTLRVDALPDPDGEATVVARQVGGGGSAANVAAGLCDLDVPAGLVGSVGDDDHADRIRDELEGRGVDLAHLRTAPGETAVKYLIVDAAGEVMVLGSDGANETIGPADLDPSVVEGVAHVHLTGQRPATAARLAALADEVGATVSIDPGRQLGRRDFATAIDRADVVLVNEREADAARAAGADPAHQLVVEKHGPAGATASGPAGRTTHPGVAVDAVDTAGAGDAFAAGFLAVSLDDGPTERALAWGNACGALAARDAGARTTLSREAVSELLAGRK